MLHAYATATAAVLSAPEERFSVELVDVETGEDLGIALNGAIYLIESDGTVADLKTLARSFDVGSLEPHCSF